MKRVFFLALTATALGVLSGCTTWDRMSAREKAAVGGAAVGGVVPGWTMKRKRGVFWLT